MDLSDEERATLEQGLRARELLHNETIASTINALSTDLTNAILSTQPHEQVQRETLYMRHRGLTDLVAILQQLDMAAAGIEAKVREEETVDNKEIDYT